MDQALENKVDRIEAHLKALVVLQAMKLADYKINNLNDKLQKQSGGAVSVFSDDSDNESDFAILLRKAYKEYVISE